MSEDRERELTEEQLRQLEEDLANLEAGREADFGEMPWGKNPPSYPPPRAIKIIGGLIAVSIGLLSLLMLLLGLF